MSYVYIKSEPQLWTVGYYGPSGQWFSESDHGDVRDAAFRVHWLNGGHIDNAELLEALKHISHKLPSLIGRINGAKSHAIDAATAKEIVGQISTITNAAIAKAKGLPCPTN